MRIIRENARYDQNEVPCQVIGTLPAYQLVQGVHIAKGRFLTRTDERHARNVCVLTVGLAKRLFGCVKMIAYLHTSGRKPATLSRCFSL